MKELSIFIDESGDFGEYDIHAPFYIIGMVFHDQSQDISEELKKLEKMLSNSGWPDHCVHAGPAIRAEYEFKSYSMDERQHIIKSLMAFARKLGLKNKTIYVEKKNLSDSVEMVGKLSKSLSGFIRANLEWFLGYDAIKVYYDNGQVELTRILSSVFSILLDNVEFKKVIPSKYRLFQVADLVCTLKLTELKLNNHILSKSEQLFFKDERTLKKNYLKIIRDKEI